MTGNSTDWPKRLPAAPAAVPCSKECWGLAARRLRRWVCPVAQETPRVAPLQRPNRFTARGSKSGTGSHVAVPLESLAVPIAANPPFSAVTPAAVPRDPPASAKNNVVPSGGCAMSPVSAVRMVLFADPAAMSVTLRPAASAAMPIALPPEIRSRARTTSQTIDRSRTR